jgi:hypothetical protein
MSMTTPSVTVDGSRVSGDLVKMKDGAITLTVPGIQEPLQILCWFSVNGTNGSAR